MSFYLDINTIMNADPSLNSWADAIYAKRTLKGIDEQHNTILIFDYSKEASAETRDDEDYLSQWVLYVYVGSPEPEDVFNISTRLQEYLEAYTDSNFLDFEFNGDNQSYDPELDIYYNDIEYNVLYTKNK